MWLPCIALPFPTLPADQRYKTDIRNILALEVVLRGPRDTNEFLRTRIPSNRNDHAPAYLQLAHQCRWHVRGASRYEYGIERRFFRPALGTIGVANTSPFATCLFQVRSRSSRKLSTALDGENLACYL